MRWLTKKKAVWNRWFAWHPVCTDWDIDGGNEYIWLEWLERKTTYFHSGNRYQYRRIEGDRG